MSETIDPITDFAAIVHDEMKRQGKDSYDLARALKCDSAEVDSMIDDSFAETTLADIFRILGFLEISIVYETPAHDAVVMAENIATGEKHVVRLTTDKQTAPTP